MPESVSLSPQLQRLMQQVQKALRSGDDEAAQRAFVALVEHEPAIRRIDLSAWLEQVIGAGPRDRLIRALARQPCMGCKRGLIACEECSGKGRLEDGTICDVCTGLGASNCGFCAGSGWITYNYVPEGLRIAVVVTRVRSVLASIQTLLKKPAPVAKPNEFASSVKSLAMHAVQLNRYLGALNNAVGVAKHPPAIDGEAPPILERVRETCLNEAERLEDRLRGVLHGLVKLYESEAARTAGDKAESARRRAMFYQRIAASPDFAGTSLYHVYLQEPAGADVPAPNDG